jgi:uncharacterized protein (DUF983 family)
VTGPYYPPLGPFSTGLACKCPRCGKGPVFDGYLKVREICQECDLDLSEHDSGDGPAIFVIFILGATVVPLALWFEATFTPPLWVHAVVWGIAVIGGTLALLPPLKGVMVALQYRHRPPT